MGAKTALLAFCDGDIRPALLGAARSERTEVEALVRQIYPGYLVGPPTMARCGTTSIRRAT